MRLNVKILSVLNITRLKYLHDVKIINYVKVSQHKTINNKKEQKAKLETFPSIHGAQISSSWHQLSP